MGNETFYGDGLKYIMGNLFKNSVFLLHVFLPSRILYKRRIVKISDPFLKSFKSI